MLCLGIESSCDETALALVRDGACVDAVLASQVDVHALFGGVVPELASREHYRFIGPLYDTLMRQTGLTLDDVDVIAVTRGPGLLGALLVGVAFAKGLAAGSGKPLVGVNHLHAHLMAASLEHDIAYPALGLLVSGGHTHTYRIDGPTRLSLIGRTLDDAAGEACDKFAKLLGLPYPGGAIMDRLASQGQADAGLFPRPYTHTDSPDFSFSGLKTAAAQWLDKHPEALEAGRKVREKGTDGAPSVLCDACASYLTALAETLRIKLALALERTAPGELKSLLVAGGVAANSQVRAEMRDFAGKHGLKLVLPSPKLCTDNAVMVAQMGWLLAQEGRFHPLSVAAIPRGRRIPDDFCQKGAPAVREVVL